MTTRDQNPDSGLGAELLSVITRLNRWASRNADLALPVAQARLLGQIDALGAGRIGDLARADHCSQPTMTTQVRRLEEGGMVERTPDPADRRAVRVSLTSGGERVLGEIRAARVAALAPLVDRLPEEERERLRGALETLTDLLEAASAEPPTGKSDR